MVSQSGLKRTHALMDCIQFGSPPDFYFISVCYFELESQKDLAWKGT